MASRMTVFVVVFSFFKTRTIMVLLVRSTVVILCLAAMCCRCEACKVTPRCGGVIASSRRRISEDECVRRRQQQQQQQQQQLKRRSQLSTATPDDVVASSTPDDVVASSTPDDVVASSTSIGVGTSRSGSLATINLLTLLFYGTLGAAMPFLPVYYRQIGVSDNQIGLLGAITPAVTFFVSPLWGALADTTGRHKQIMLLTFVSSTLARTLLALKSTTSHILSLAFIVALSAALNAPVRPLLDTTILSMLEDKSMYGKSRLFGQVGFGMGSFLAGPLMNLNGRYIFWAQALLAVPTAALMARLSVRSDAVNNNSSSRKRSGSKAVVGIQKQPPQNTDQRAGGEKIDILGGLRLVAADPKVLVFFLAVLFIGISSGVIENFAYVRIGEVVDVQHGKTTWGRKGSVLGYARLASSLAGGPVFWFSGRFSRAVGVERVLMLTLLAFAVRFFVYAAMRQPWHALPAEMLRGATFALFWAASTYFVFEASPPGLTATMLSILNGVYGGIGQSLGSLLGGVLCKRVGIRHAFYLSGLADGLLLLGLMGTYQGIAFADDARSRSALRAGAGSGAGVDVGADDGGVVVLKTVAGQPGRNEGGRSRREKGRTKREQRGTSGKKGKAGGESRALASASSKEGGKIWGRRSPFRGLVQVATLLSATTVFYARRVELSRLLRERIPANLQLDRFLHNNATSPLEKANEMREKGTKGTEVKEKGKQERARPCRRTTKNK